MSNKVLYEVYVDRDIKDFDLLVKDLNQLVAGVIIPDVPKTLHKGDVILAAMWIPLEDEVEALAEKEGLPKLIFIEKSKTATIAGLISSHGFKYQLDKVMNLTTILGEFIQSVCDNSKNEYILFDLLMRVHQLETKCL